MTLKINPSNPLTLSHPPTRKPNFRTKFTINFSSSNPKTQKSITKGTKIVYSVSFKTLGAGKLGISTYPDFEYDPRGGFGLGVGEKIEDEDSKDEIFVCFDVEKMYIPALTSKTTKFLGLPLPPFLRIDIEPEVFQGRINIKSGKVDLEFGARFSFTAGGGIYRAPPLMVKTVLTSDESRGDRKRGTGERMDGNGVCRLVGVAGLQPTGDIFIDSFLRLPNECIADLNAVISMSEINDAV